MRKKLALLPILLTLSLFTGCQEKEEELIDLDQIVLDEPLEADWAGERHVIGDATSDSPEKIIEETNN